MYSVLVAYVQISVQIFLPVLQNEMKAMLQQYSLNDALVAENERLKEEIKKLKATH